MTDKIDFLFVVLVIAILLLAGCAKWEHDPLAVYQADPKALEIPVTTFAIFPF
jgi:PBP1b-binding outer membrane lipoprotein LpoB